MTSSLALMLALAIDEIEQLRMARSIHREHKAYVATLDAGVPVQPPGFTPPAGLPREIFEAELDKPDEDDVIGLWGVDMAAAEEYAYQKPGCQFFILEAMRRGIGIYCRRSPTSCARCPCTASASGTTTTSSSRAARASSAPAPRTCSRRWRTPRDARRRPGRDARAQPLRADLDEPVRDAARHGDPADAWHRPWLRHHALRRPAGVAHDGGGAEAHADAGARGAQRASGRAARPRALLGAREPRERGRRGAGR
jgi:hypothetical protein